MDPRIKIALFILFIIVLFTAIYLIASGSAALFSNANNVTLDQQLGLVFYNTSNVIAYNITAIAQASPNGTGPAYLINGLTNTGKWYQLGLAYNWSSYYPGFSVELSLANPTNSSSLNESAEAENCSGIDYSYPFQWISNVNPNDKVLLELSLSNGTVNAYVKDWSTGAHADATFSDPGATQFVGGVDDNGFFTGLMTEEYRNTSYARSQEEVVYQPYQHYMDNESNLSLFADEFYSSCSSINVTQLYNLNTTMIPYNGSASITSNGVNVSYNNGIFITGGS